jgi:hypothetical protein
MANEGLKQLRELALQASRWKHPDYPEKWRCAPDYTDRTANGLTKCIMAFLKFNGYLGERINSTGRYIDNSRTVTDILGDSRRIGSNRWIGTAGLKGTADISAIIRGHSIKIEVKMKDRQSPDQKAYQEAVEKAGGLYWLCHSYDEFLNFFNELK